MRWIDLLRMSSNSLKRRKLRTFLTVLGVVIGTASIVVMISLGLGLQESMYQEIEQSGGVTSLTVTGKGSSQMGGFYMGDTSNEEEATKYTTDDVIEQIKKLDHVADVQPVLSIDALLKKNGYIGYCPLTGMTEEGLKDLNIKLAPGGSLPKAGSAELDLVIGNNVITNFSEESTGKMYWETGVLPDIDLAHDSLFLILDQEAYYSSQSPSTGAAAPESGRQSKSVFRIRCLLNETRFRNRREENAGRNGCLHRWHINRNQRCPRTGRKKSPMCCNRDWGNRSGRPFCSWRRLHRSGLGM